MSCFDFDEDEEETRIPDATSGRKIPRVIPISERRTTFELEEVLVDEEEEKKKKILEESEELAKLTEPPVDEDKEVENLEKTYQSLMESTENIALVDVPNILKNEQNFHSAKTVKYPDKPKEASSDSIEAKAVEHQAEKSEEAEKVEEILTVEEIVEEPVAVENIALCDSLDEEEAKQTTKGKRKRRSIHTNQPRRSTRSKPELTEADIDVAFLKLNPESEVWEQKEDSSNIQVPLNVLSPSKAEEHTVEVEIITETEKIEVNSQEIQEELANISNKDTTLNNDESREAHEKQEPNQLDSSKTLDNVNEHPENVVLVEEVVIEEDVVKDKNEDVSEIAVEFVVEQPLEVCTEETIATESVKTAEEPSEIAYEPILTTTEVEKNELNETEDKDGDEESQPEPKRRKTTRGYSRSSKSKEPSSQGARRGRSKDAEMLKLEESSSSSLSESKSQKEQYKSVPTRKSTRWDRKLSNENKETSHTENAADPIEEISQSSKELEDVTLKNVETIINVDVHDKESTCVSDSQQKTENNEKPSMNEEDRKDSVPIEEAPSKEPSNEQDKEFEQVEEDISLVEVTIIPEEKTEDCKDVEQSSPRKTEITTEERTSDKEIERKSSHRSPRKEKRSSRSGRDRKKVDSSKLEDSSSHKESDRSLRGDNSSQKEESSSRREGKRSLRGDTSSHREEDSSLKADDSSSKGEKRSLRGSNPSCREDDRTLRGDNSLHREEDRSLKADNSFVKEEKRSLRGNNSSNREDDRSLKGDNSSQREDDRSLKADISPHKEEKRSLRGNNTSHREDDRSLRGDNSSHREDDRSLKEDNSSHKGEKRSLRGNNPSHKDDRFLKSNNSSHKEDDRSLRGDSSSHKDGKRSLRGDKSSRKEDDRSHKDDKFLRKDDRSVKEDNSSQREDNFSHRSSRSGRGSSRQEKEKQESAEGSKTTRSDESPIKHPKDSSSSRKSSSSKDSHCRKVEIPTSNDQEDDSQRNTRKDKKSSRTDQDSQNHKTLNEQESDDRKEHNLSSRSSRRHGRSSKNSRESSKSDEKETRVSSSSNKQDNFSPIKEKLQSSSQKSPKASKQVDPIKALFSTPETVAKTKEQKREELKNIFSFDYDEEELKKRKTYSHKRKPKPVVQEKTAELAVPPEMNKVEVSSEVREVPSTEHEDKNVDGTVEETAVQPCLENIEPSVISESEASKGSSQQSAEETERPKEVTVEKDEIPNVPEEKESLCSSEVPPTETNQEMIESKKKDETEIAIETVVIGENQNDNLLVPEEKVTELNRDEKIIVDSKQECSDSKLKEKELSANEKEDKKGADRSTRRKKPRKPSRWDQKEKTDVVDNQELVITENSVEEMRPQIVQVEPVKEAIVSQIQVLEEKPAKETIESQLQSLQSEHATKTIEGQLQSLQEEPAKETIESQLQSLEAEPARETIESTLEILEEKPVKENVESNLQILESESAQEIKVNSDIPESTLEIDETSQKEMNDIFSKKESSELADKNAAQIELIFGSSPLPGLSENNIFIEKVEKSETSVDKQDLSVPSEEKKKEDNVSGDDLSHNSSFEQANDLLESVESQVARITHYEEPVPKVEKSFDQHKVSIFDTPEKQEKPVHHDSPESKTDGFPDSSSTCKSLESGESCNYSKPETSTTSAPKTKKTYLLSEQAIRETEKSPEIVKEKSTSYQDVPLPSKSADKTNEVATKLTNPKKRFVKSFEDSELIKKIEKSLEAGKSNNTEVKTEKSSLMIGKSPIAFKLKKQFLSKISNIFDEADEKKETKILPKLKSTRHDTIFKKKDTTVTEKIETEITNSCEEKTIPQAKTENEELAVADVVNEIDVVSTENKLEKSDTPSENLENSCQETSEPNVSEVEKLSTTDLPASEVKCVSENSISFPFESTEESNELKTVVPEESAEYQRDSIDIDVSKTEIITTNFPLDEDKKEETEYVSIDGNLTVVSEKELAEGQVEITASMPIKKPMTLLNFSMDFSDDSTDASFEAFKNEKIQGITESLDSKNVEEENKGKQQDDLDSKKKEESIDEKGNELIVCEERKKDFDVKQKVEAVDIKEKSPEANLKLTNDFEKESASSSTTTTQIAKQVEKAETKKQEIHDISLEDILKSSIPIEKAKELSTNTKDADGDIFSILSEHVKLTNRAASESKSKHKDSEKPVASKKTERRSQLCTAEAVPVVNEPLVIYNTAKSSTVTDMCDLEDHIPSQIVCTKNALINDEVMKVAGINNELNKETAIQNTEPQVSKLLSRLTTDKKEDPISKIKSIETEAKQKESELKSAKVEPSVSKNLLKAAIKSKTMANTAMPYPGKPVNKAIILSEKIIRPARETPLTAGLGPKRTYEDVEDIEPYVITKTPKLDVKKDESAVSGTQKIPSSAISKLAVSSPKQFVYSSPNKQLLSFKKSTGKAKILNQTIIRPAGESIQAKALTEDNVDFDINSMPIVLSDELLTPETLESIPIVLGEQAQKPSPSDNIKIVIEKKAPGNSKLVTKTATVAHTVNSPTIRMPIVKKTTPKILQTPKQTQKIIRQVTPSVSTKSTKFVVVSDSSPRPGQVIKKQTNLVRKTLPVTCTASSTPSGASESTGHKIMIFTNQQGKQQRLLLTPAQQKLFNMQGAGKTVMKSATAAQKSQLAKVQNSGLASTSKLPGQNVQSPKLVKTTVGTTVAAPPQMKIVPPRKTQKVFMPGNQMGKPLQQKTILITNQHGQTVRKIHGTNDALLDKQVAEQLEAIKVSSMKAQQKQHEVSARVSVANKPVQGVQRKAVVKRSEPKQTVVAPLKPTAISGPSRFSEQHHVPPLTPIKQDKKDEELMKQTTQAKPTQVKQERPLHQLVIQDNAGNQTTITEGQILALPSETVDGQPQSYMLVTLDETGNLTPLNNEALMSLDPSLAGLTGGDLSNMVLQMDAGAQKGNLSQTAQLQAAPTIVQEKPKQEIQQVAPPKPAEQIVAPLEQPAAQVQVTCNINGEPGQQIILTGDPAATQKFLDSLSDGSTDLANILAGAEGNSFLIQADGQQILINTEPTEAPLMRHNTGIAEQPEHRSPMFSTHPVKNQDILAAALADTDVFQQDQVTNHGKLTHSQLSPGQTLFPMNVSNVLETSLTLNSPIMTPLEVPSTNSKRIPDEEADILTTHVPKNVDLPITITDPNISQTVSHQQVLMASDLQSNLELSLPISETSMCVTSGMNSPSFVYSLPTLDVSEHTEINQKTFSSSMPLLTEDIEESPAFAPLPSKAGEIRLNRTESSSKKQNRNERHGIAESIGATREMMTTSGTFMEEGLCTLGAEMCSSLSEPPPEMFDIPMESDGLNFLNKSQNESKEKSDPVNSGLLMDDNSLEMPVQSHIAVEFKDSSQSSDSSSSVSQDKTL